MHWRMAMPTDGFVRTMTFVAVLAVCSFAAGCGSSRSFQSGLAGKSTSYVAGEPVYDLEAIPTERGTATGVDLFFSIPSSSLTFVKFDDEFQAINQLSVHIHTPEGDTLVLERAWAETTMVSTYDETQRFEPFVVRHFLAVAPGNYVVDSRLESADYQRAVQRRQAIQIRDPNDSRPGLEKILIEAKADNGKFLPVIPFHVASGLDSLRSAATVVNGAPIRDAETIVDLVRFHSDSLAARAPYDPVGIDLPEGYGALNFTKADTLLVRSGSIPAGSRMALLTVPLENLRPGNYLVSFQVQTALPAGTGDTVMHAERFISMCGPTFPKPSTLGELVASFVYIARKKEMARLTHPQSAEQQRAVFDSIWLRFGHDRQEAATLLKRYYSRIQEANILFTAAKEGWKTDRGMVYAVLGPPLEIMNSMDRQTWYYDLPGDAASNVYTFHRQLIQKGDLTLVDYILYRAGYYEYFWDRMVEKWRTGEIF